MERNYGEKLKNKVIISRKIYCKGKSTLNVSVLMNLPQDFRIVIPSVDRTIMDV